ncbi:MAG TPA: hypothetical protein VK190_04640 [Pseudoneobacillus sp.]|nr:hypothetical protein [Pseudoneobacillus sp.]
MANVVTGKIGRSAYFDRKKWKDAAGNNEFPILLSAIAKLNPQNTYFMIGKSDISRVDEKTYKEWFPHQNVVDVWKGFNPKKDDPTTWIWEKLKEEKIDYGIIHGGMVSLSIPNRIYCLDRKTGKPDYSKIRSPIMSLVNYVSPITYYLNESKIDWITVTSDGRYMPLQARDLINPEKISLGVREGSVEIERMKSYEDQETMIKHKVELRYVAAETQFLLDPKFKTRPNKPKTQKVALFFHQYDDKKRIKAILDVVECFNHNEISIYGKWPEYQDSDFRFEGPVSFEDLQDILPSVKYTFCYPIIKGDISGKWVESVANGIIPFFHETYDEDRLLVKYHKVPEWLYVKSGAEMKEKIEYLENNPKAYDKMRKILKDAILQDRYKDGTFLDKMITQAIIDIQFE